MGGACEKRLEEGGRPEGMEMFLFFGHRGIGRGRGRETKGRERG